MARVNSVGSEACSGNSQLAPGEERGSEEEEASEALEEGATDVDFGSETIGSVFEAGDHNSGKNEHGEGDETDEHDGGNAPGDSPPCTSLCERLMIGSLPYSVTWPTINSGI